MSTKVEAQEISNFCRTPSLSIKDSAEAPIMADDREVGVGKPPLEVQKHNDIDGDHENLPFTSSSPDFAEDVPKSDTDLKPCAGSSGLEKSEVGCSIDRKKDALHEPEHSRREDLSPDAISRVDGSHGSSAEHLLSNIPDATETVNHEKASGNNPTAVETPHEPASCLNLDISSDELVVDAPKTNVLQSELHRSFQEISPPLIPTTSLEVDNPTRSTSTCFLLDEKMEEKSSNEMFEAIEDGTLGGDSTSFLSALHNGYPSTPSDLNQFPQSSSFQSTESSKCTTDPESQQLRPSCAVVLNNNFGLDNKPVNVERTTYDPSKWTPMEIETATGNSDCTVIEHHLKLRSSYSEVEVDHIFRIMYFCYYLPFTISEINFSEICVLGVCFIGFFRNKRLEWRTSGDQLQ